MLVKEIEYYKNGSPVNPNRKYSEDDRKKYDELRKAKRNRERRKKEASKFKRKIVAQCIGITFIAGLLALKIDSMVFSAQQELTNINKNIDKAEKHNEDLKVKLLQTGSLSDIETNAQNRLGMMSTTKANVVEIDLSNNYFQTLDDKDKEESEKSVSFIDKIKGIFN